MGHSCRMLHYSNNTSADDVFISTAKTDINQFISGKPIHFGYKSQSTVSVQNLILIKKNQEPSERENWFRVSSSSILTEVKQYKENLCFSQRSTQCETVKTTKFQSL